MSQPLARSEGMLSFKELSCLGFVCVCVFWGAALVACASSQARDWSEPQQWQHRILNPLQGTQGLSCFFLFFSSLLATLQHIKFLGQGSNLRPSAPKMPPILLCHSGNSRGYLVNAKRMLLFMIEQMFSQWGRFGWYLMLILNEQYWEERRPKGRENFLCLAMYFLEVNLHISFFCFVLFCFLSF